GFFRGIGKPGISIILTITSLGARVALAYLLSSIPSVGIVGIWWSIPIGWALADVIGLIMVKSLSKE
ncbi:MAG TPA: MATE family efflux transporter, partial [Lachnospiraceae bacterium]|nr:MATE family efflux transporter [Lachnospiraceae bacterium]